MKEFQIPFQGEGSVLKKKVMMMSSISSGR